MASKRDQLCSKINCQNGGRLWEVAIQGNALWGFQFVFWSEGYVFVLAVFRP